MRSGALIGNYSAGNRLRWLLQEHERSTIVTPLAMELYLLLHRTEHDVDLCFEVDSADYRILVLSRFVTLEMRQQV